ncbi:MAG TPA: YaeQ family protein [Thermoanaerobaculia bacterium]|nr:YaeQ family protein [Thermoanaerobaculia bacterium]
MALTSTMYTATVELSDVDRGVYETLDLRLAMHPSESAEYLTTRLLAYCLEYTEGIEFTSGLSNGEEPAIVVRDLTGRITAWIEIGAPDADRLHRASKLAQRVVVYTHRDLRNVLGQLDGKKIHRASEIPIYTFGRGFIDELAARLERRMRVTLSVTEQHIYLDVDGASFTTVIEEHHIDAGV